MRYVACILECQIHNGLDNASMTVLVTHRWFSVILAVGSVAPGGMTGCAVLCSRDAKSRASQLK